jgi:hypothetical protein
MPLKIMLQCGVMPVKNNADGKKHVFVSMQGHSLQVCGRGMTR